MSKKKLPHIDEAEVDAYVEFVQRHADFSRCTPEDRADTLRRIVLDACQEKHTAEYSKALADKVYRRMLWGKPVSSEPSA